MKNTITTLLFGIVIYASSCHAVQVTFSGSSRINQLPFQHQPNPFGDNSTFSGSFSINESVIPTPLSSISTFYYLEEAIENFTVNVAGHTFTGEKGQGIQSRGRRRRQFADSFYVQIGTGRGIFPDSPTTINSFVNGILGADDILTRIRFRAFGSLFYTPGHVDRVINNLTTPNFASAGLLLRFLNTQTSQHTEYSFKVDNVAIGLSAENSPLTPTPIPAAIWLFISGILGLSGLASYKNFTAKLIRN